jgi:hypothetical protein
MDPFAAPPYIKDLIAAINDGAKSAQLGALAFTAIGLFLLATAFSATDEDLLLNRALTISQLGGNGFGNTPWVRHLTMNSISKHALGFHDDYARAMLGDCHAQSGTRQSPASNSQIVDHVLPVLCINLGFGRNRQCQSARRVSRGKSAPAWWSGRTDDTRGFAHGRGSRSSAIQTAQSSPGRSSTGWTYRKTRFSPTETLTISNTASSFPSETIDFVHTSCSIMENAKTT